MCQTSTLFTRNSAKNHLATHGTTIQDYEKRYGAPLQRVLPGQQSQPVPSPSVNVGHTVAVSRALHLPPVCTQSEQPPSNPGHATSQLHSVYTYPYSQSICESEQPVPEIIGDVVQSVPQVSGESIHCVPQHNVDPETSIFDPQLSSISIPISGSQIYPSNLRPGILGPVSESDILRFLF